MNYSINDIWHYQLCILPSALDYFVNTVLHHHRTTHYASYYTLCTTPSRMHLSATLDYSVNGINDIIDAALHHQRCITSSRKHYILNAKLHLQRCTISSILHHTVNAALKSRVDALLHMRVLSNPLTPYYLVPYQKSCDVKFCIKSLQFHIDLSFLSWGR